MLAAWARAWSLARCVGGSRRTMPCDVVRERALRRGRRKQTLAEPRLQRCAARDSGGANRAGMNDWRFRAAPPSAPAPANPTDAVPAFNVKP
jgi:hypothetical protein